MSKAEVSSALYASRYNSKMADSSSTSKLLYVTVAVICVVLALALVAFVAVYVTKDDDSASNTEPLIGTAPSGCKKNEFTCETGLCIGASRWCDGTLDCPDGSDEVQDCGKKCKKKEFKCETGQCIDLSLWCDGNPDCPDWSDERNDCGKGCHWTQFSCDNNTCLDQSRVCDTVEDCLLGEDEDHCVGDCQYFSCNNSKCIDVINKCDGLNDCGDWSDELVCGNCSEHNLFQCLHPPICLQLDNWCSGQADCPDASDEVEGCENACPTGFKGCSDTGGECIAEQSVCDGQLDCGNGSDEMGCVCNSTDRLLCGNDLCLKSDFKCDGMNDCGDFTDEHDCDCSSADKFLCEGEPTVCLKNDLFCNGSPDCPDASDESSNCSAECLPGQLGCPSRNLCFDETRMCRGEFECQDDIDYNNYCQCDKSEFKCENGMCMGVSLWCDGTSDCPDGSDEIEDCGGVCAPEWKSCNDSSSCFHLSDECDGSYDCDDMSDEMGCVCKWYQFECDNLCIFETLWCDGNKDCPFSGMDELDCNDTCPPGRHRCNFRGGICLPLSKMCDGFPDCHDWSDEMNCTHCVENAENMTHCGDPPTCISEFLWCTGMSYCMDGADNPEGCECRDSQFDCVIGEQRCIPLDDVCDERSQCKDRRDEWNCECPENRCDTGYCMRASVWCDGINDCADWSDEIGCECTEDQLLCEDGLTCFFKHQWCDGYSNCQDESDEKDNCTCLEEQFSCQGYCLPSSKRCDGRVDCMDGTDEAGCECAGFRCRESLECFPSYFKCDGYDSCRDHSDEEGCEEFCNDKFTCGNGRCVEQSMVCDQYNNCGDNSDEQDCQYECLEEEFQCDTGNCIPKSWLCDLIADCDAGEDESKAQCANCNPDEKPCRGGETCYLPSQTCDGVEQCQQGEDEHHCFSLDKDSAEDGEPQVVKATKDDTGYDGICSDNWSEDWTSAICTHLGYESGRSQTFVDAPQGATLLIPQALNPTSGQLLDKLLPGNCASGKMVSVACVSTECGTVPLHSNAFSSYIINGQDAAPGAWPWQIQMFFGASFQCGGSIVDHHWIVTAAHCIASIFGHTIMIPPSYFTIQAGHYRNGVPDPNSRFYRIDKLLAYPDYAPIVFDKDIALVRTKQYIEYTDYIRPVCIANSSFDPSKAVECFTSGWGTITLPRALPTQLQQSKMSILPVEYCQEYFDEGAGTNWNLRPYIIRNETQVCAGFPPKPITACYGDSGGPLVCRDQHFRWTLAGVASWGTDCKGISIYARVSAFSDWLQSQIAEHTP